MIEASVSLGRPLDLVTTLAPLRHGAGDRTVLLAAAEAWLAWREPNGPAAIRLRVTTQRSLHATAWGDGADAALARVPALIGEADDPDALVACHPIVRELQRRHSGLRLPRSGRVFDALVPSILEQKVTGTEAFRAYAALQRRYAERAPGPMRQLRLPVTPEVLAALPYHAFHPLGVERRRADVIRRAARRAGWLDASVDATQAARRLRSLPGVGPWTTAEVVRSAFGDPDAVSIGDFHIPHSVAWALAGEPRGTDARMLELLEPYRGQRGRVQRLLEVGRITAPRYGPRLAPRSIAAI
ncbi:MAG TPA: DNA-3-methyladenine glycosylase 2 family protein [Candidatus Limnocylindria bacterium]|nr:DNA-3-methyladenine glycosylase 2 family protein [Candidatus Limnocylindria bacterium]